MAELKDDEDSSFGDDDGAGFAADDLGGDDDDFDNDAPHGDVFPLASIHDGNHRFSSESFQTTFQSKQPPSQASILLDAIASGDISGSRSKYEYFNKKALESIQGNNQWAGSAHWRKLQPKRTMVSNTALVEDGKRATAAKKKRSKNKATGSGGLLIDISKTSADLKVLLKKPPKAKKGASQPLQMTKAAVSKAAKDDNLLPLDAGINVENLTCLFSRPNTNVMDLATSEPGVPLRHVGFRGIETWGNDDNSYGDDYQGSGIAFGGGYNEDDANDPEDFCIPELEGIRKVAKVRIGYATVAKQVDVKRLKTDLWLELERTFKERNMQVDAEKDDDESVDSSFAQKAEEVERLNESPIKDSTAPLSFQQTVRDMQASQSQTDVTLPFYFICILHLANEKGLVLESTGLEDFIIRSCL
jgi:condensin complex subunit 2